MRRADDSEAVEDTMSLLGRMFLAMLARLDGLGLIGDNTAVKSLGCTMAMYMTLAGDWGTDNLISDDDRKRYTSRPNAELDFQLPDSFNDAILSYAQKRGVSLRGPDNIDELVAQADQDVDLPEKNDKDPWGWKAALRRYKKKHTTDAGGIGGDSYDITAMSSAERKEASFTRKDPLTKKDISAIKGGMILQPSW